jgi:cholesterol transport system auxiliary component
MSRVAGLICMGAAVALAGCSLLPKDTATLYRFGQPSPAQAVATQGTVAVLRGGGTFQRESAGDKLLTLSDGKVAYIAETRWAAPAPVLWDEAVLAAFDADPGRARLVSRGELGSAAYVLRLDVRNFEAHYDQGAKAAPQVVMRVRATMTPSGGGAVNERIFESRVRASDNRVSAIVPAYEKAVAEVLGQIVPWTNELAAPV